MLAVDAGADGVTVVAVAPDGTTSARAHHGLAPNGPARHGAAAPDALWRATLSATREVLAGTDAAALQGLGVTCHGGDLVLWDRETLGSPRPLVTGRGPGGTTAAALTAIAADEPHTWALVRSGRYAVGTVDSYLVARMTRGTWHLTDVGNAAGTGLLDLGTADWSDERCAAAGVPGDALPELVPSWGEVAVTDPTSFCGLALPVAGVAAGEQAALFGQACFEEGQARSEVDDGAAALVNAGTDGHRTTLAWRSPDGVVVGASRDPDDVAVLRVDGAAAADDRSCQQLADRAGVPVERPRELGAAVLGAAHLAGLGTGTWSSTGHLRELWQLDRRFEPRTG